MRTVVWFSCGAASTVAAYLTLKDNPKAVLVYCDTGGEHEDNKRYLDDVQRWLGKKIIILRNKKYKDHFDVCKKTKYINDPKGARCTVELKKKLRFNFQKADDVQIFGYTCEERDRAERFKTSFPEVNAKFPLIDKLWTKESCLGFIEKVGIKLPAMYILGFNNNNCMGCVKGGAGYWNKIKKHFPEKFKEMAKIERELGASCIKGKFLDELKEGDGRISEPKISCDFVCIIESNTLKIEEKETRLSGLSGSITQAQTKGRNEKA